MTHLAKRKNGYLKTRSFRKKQDLAPVVLGEGMTEMLRNNPPDVVFSAFSQVFFRGAIRMFRRDSEMNNIVYPRCRSARTGNPALLQPGVA